MKTEVTEEEIRCLIRAMKLGDPTEMFHYFQILEGTANELKEEIENNYNYSVPEVNRELDRVKDNVVRLQSILGTLNPEVAFKLNREHNSDGKPLTCSQEPVNKAAIKILDTIYFYCEQAKKNNEKHLDFPDLEILLANEFEKQGGVIKISDTAPFTVLLRGFRDRCDFPGYQSPQVKASYISRLLDRRKKNRTYPQDSQKKTVT